MASRFWGGGSSSEDEQSSDEESVEEQQQIVQKSTDRKFAAAFDESDSESDDEVRVVRSQKDRAFEAIHDAILKLRNARKNEDWSLIQDEFANVNKQIAKSKMTIVQYGMPKAYIKMLAELEDHVGATLKDKEAVKKMKAVGSRALNQMKLQVKKHNEEYRADIDDFRANPAKYEEESDDEEEDEDNEDDEDDKDSDENSEKSSNASDEDDDESVEVKGKSAKKPARKAAADDESDSDWDSKGEESEEDSEDEEEEKQIKGRWRWVKKEILIQKFGPQVDDKKRDKRKDDKKTSAVKAKKDDKKKESIDAKRVVSSWVTQDLMTAEELDKRLADIIASRGKKVGDNRESLRQLEMLAKVSRRLGPQKEIPTLMHLIAMMFDSQRSIDDYMDHQLWKTCYRSLNRVLQMLESEPALTLVPLGGDDVAELTLAFARPDQSASEETKVDHNKVKVVGSVESFVSRLEEDYIKALQQINPHTQEYVFRLADEAALVELEYRALRYYEQTKDVSAAAVIALLIIEHLYYKHESHAASVAQAHAFNKKWGNYRDLHPACRGKQSASETVLDSSMRHPAAFQGNPTASCEIVDSSKEMDRLCGFIFKHGEKRSKTRALLCLVYHHAMHDRYYQARDLFLLSHLQESIDLADVKTQILYNRTLANMGLCAFRLGMYAKAHDSLSQICNNRTKELLAQGTARSADKDPEQERLEKRRQMPYHMHINPDLLECCHLTSAMILELPLRAKGSRLEISRQLNKHLNSYKKQPFTGPPETTREHVLAATIRILTGNWKEACGYLMGLEVWNFIPGGGGAKVKQQLQVRIQEEAVRCYLLQQCENYDAISLNTLCAMFEMDSTRVRRMVCKMIFNKEIAASLQTSKDVLVFYKTEPNVLQSKTIEVSDRIVQLQESNERIVDTFLNGLYGFKDEWKSDGKKTDDRYSNQRRNKHLGWKGTSQRPVISRAKTGNQGNRMNFMKGAAGNVANAGGNKNAWSNANKLKRQQNSHATQGETTQTR